MSGGEWHALLSFSIPGGCWYRCLGRVYFFFSAERIQIIYATQF
jgi:hypothetical protein